ncbi:Inosose dehydratase [subsurface metagenome]
MIFAALVLAVGIVSATARTNYDDVRIKKFPFAMQCWTFHKFTFFETIEKVDALGIEYLQAYAGQPLSKDNPDVVFGPELSDEQLREVRRKLMDRGLSIISYGVVNFDNNLDSIESVFELAKKMGIRTIVTEPRFDDYSLIEQMVKKYNINIAIHNHPIPTKYARPETALARIEGLDQRIGICADTGHWMRSGVNPVEALQMFRGRVTDVHLKDLNEFGVREAYDVPFGSGKANIRDILAELTLHDYRGFISIEHENEKELDNPSPSIKKGLDYVKSITYYEGYEQILQRRGNSYSKNGWNHYGPGYFELDRETGVLTSHGGMGLFWYSGKKLKNFELLVDFKTSHQQTNSGIFLRVPEMLSSNDYIYHSFEIQIDDRSEGIHHTGAVYDSEPPRENASNPTGEWNHYKITFNGDVITVELNGRQVTNWKAEPRGKIRDFAEEGYIGLQNHDPDSYVYFKNIYIKELP